MKEYLNFREETLLKCIKNYYHKTLEVRFILPPFLAKLTPFNDYEEFVNTAMALEIRNYLTLENKSINAQDLRLQATLTEKALNVFNNPDKN